MHRRERAASAHEPLCITARALRADAAFPRSAEGKSSREVGERAGIQSADLAAERTERGTGTRRRMLAVARTG